MKDIFQLRINGNRTETVETRKTFTSGTNRISYLGQKIWNSLPSHYFIVLFY